MVIAVIAVMVVILDRRMGKAKRAHPAWRSDDGPLASVQDGHASLCPSYGRGDS
jgi:hypothetical protein